MSEHMRVMAILGGLGPDWSDWVAQLLATRPIAQVSFQEVCIRIRKERTRREQTPSHASRSTVTRKTQASSSKQQPALKQSQLSLHPPEASKEGNKQGVSTPTPSWPPGGYTSFFRHGPSPAATNEHSDCDRGYNAPSTSSYVGKGKGRAYDTPSTASFVQLEPGNSTIPPQLQRKPSYIFLPSHSSTSFQNSNASISSCRTTMMPPPSSRPVRNHMVLQDKPFKIWTPETMSKRIAQPKRPIAAKSIATMFVPPKQPPPVNALRSQPEAAETGEHDLITSLNLSPATATSYHSLPRGSPRRFPASCSDESESELFTTPKSTLEHDTKPSNTTQGHLSAATRVTEMFTRALAEKSGRAAIEEQTKPPIVARPLDQPSSPMHSSSPSSLMLRRFHRKPRRPVLSDSVLSQCLIQPLLSQTPTPRAPIPIVANREPEVMVKAGKLKHVRRPEVAKSVNLLGSVASGSKPVRESISNNGSGKSELEFVYSPFMNLANTSDGAGHRPIIASNRLRTPSTPITRQEKESSQGVARSPSVHDNLGNELPSTTRDLLPVPNDVEPSSVQVCASIEDESLPESRKRTTPSPDPDVASNFKYSRAKRLKANSSPSSLARIAFKPVEQIDDATQEAAILASLEVSHPEPVSECDQSLMPTSIRDTPPLSSLIPASPREHTATEELAGAKLAHPSTPSLDEVARSIAAWRAAGLTTLDVEQIILPTMTANVTAQAPANKISKRRERRKLKRERRRLARHLASTDMNAG